MDHHDLKNMRTLDRLNCVQPHDVVVDVGASVSAGAAASASAGASASARTF